MAQLELKEGFMSSKDLAAWAGISYGSYRKKDKKQQVLEDLKKYCDYKEMYGGVQISKVLIPIHFDPNNLDSMDRRTLLTYLGSLQNDLFSGAMITRYIQFDKLDGYDRSYDRISARMNKQASKLFGKVTRENKHGEGEIGTRDLTFVIIVDRYNYREMTKEEHDILFDVIRQKTTNDPDIVFNQLMLDEYFAESKMTKEEYVKQKKSLRKNLFWDIKSGFMEITGFNTTTVSRFEINMLKMSDADREAYELGKKMRGRVVGY